MPEVLFSVIIPTYNRSAMLSVAVESVLRQTCEDWELIVIDDASTDDTQAKLRAYKRDERVRVYRNETNQERSRSRNIGIDKATGRYVCFLDSDDFFEEQHLQRLKAEIERRDFPVALLHTHVVKIDQQRMLRQRIPILVDPARPVESVIERPIPIITVAIHRDCLQDNRFDAELIINEDIYLLARIASQYPVISVNAFTVNWMIHGLNTVDYVKDHFTPQVQAADRMFADPMLQKYLSEDFRRRHYFNLYTQMVYYHRQHTFRAAGYARRAWQQVPGWSNNKNNWLTILYHLPGGSLLRAARNRMRKLG